MMENNYDFKIIGTTHDYFADAIAAGKPTMTGANCWEHNVNRFAMVINAYVKAKANINTIKSFPEDKSFCDISTNIGVGISRTNISRIVLAHFGLVYGKTTRYKDKDKNILNYNVYDMENLLCNSNVQRQDAFKQFFINKNSKARAFFVPSTLTPLPVFLNTQQVIDICTCYIIEHIDTAIEYMNKFHPNVAKQFANTSLVGMPVIQTVTAPQPATNVVYQTPAVGTKIDIAKLKRIATLTNNIADNKCDIVNSIMAAIVVHGTVENAKADIANIKDSVVKCLKEPANANTIVANVNDISDILITSL